ncbi:glycosyltransferase [Candidatus Halobeggiatoa sp. HSG11]|nr:glycosyltransferase [Candidatus Halobeggiatoa sp. HSG11]
MQQNTPTIAVIIRTKDRPHLLTRSLQSLVEQKHQPNEIVVINDGGVNVENVITDFSDLNISLISNDANQGRANAGNQGVQATHCDVIGFLDDDDRLLPDHLQRLINAMSHFDAKVVYSGCRLLKRDLLGEEVILQEQAIGQFNEPYDAQRLNYENYIPLINLLIDRKLWEEVGGFDIDFDMFEDWDLLLRLSKHTSFYHVDNITAEYAIWGNNQITQTQDQQNWLAIYEQFLTKNLISLPAEEQLKNIVGYWRLTQERRGIMQNVNEEKQTLQLKLLQTTQKLEKFQHELAQQEDQTSQLQKHCTDWSNKYEQLQIEWNRKYGDSQTEWNHKYEDSQTEWVAKYQQLQSDYNLLQSDWINKYQQLQSDHAKEHSSHAKEHAKEIEKLQTVGKKREVKLQKEFDKLEQKYFALQTAAQQEQQKYEWLQNTHHELSQQIAVGLTQGTLERLLQAPNHVTTAVDDYHRLLNWIRDKAGQFADFEKNIVEQTQPLHAEYQSLLIQVHDLIQLISASRWPQIRRYANAVRDIETNVANLFSNTDKYISKTSCFNLKLTNHTVAEIPPSRPLSDIYPTFMTFAGTEAEPQNMENVGEFGKIPLFLDANTVLVFTTYCSVNDFFRLDLFLGTLLRINTCQVRIIIREQNGKVIRVAYFDAMEALDNNYYSVLFEPIIDSAGKLYQIEIDAPYATGDSCIAIWCNNKLSGVQPLVCQNPTITADALPNWIQQTLMDLPLPQNLNAEKPTHLFVINGIVETTSVLDLHVFLGKLATALTDSSGQVIICGILNQELQQYCEQAGVQTLVCNQEKPDSSMLQTLTCQDSCTSEYLWCCDINAVPQTDIVERAMEMFNSKVGLLIPMEKSSDNKIRAGFAAQGREGVLHTPAAGATSDHPYYAYRREIYAASSQLIIIKTTCLSQLDTAKIASYQTQMYQVTELIWQLQEYQTLYEAALCYEHNCSYPTYTESDYNVDCQNFYQRWQDKLPINLPILTHISDLLNPLKQPTVLIIDATLPTFDEDSGSLRLYTLMKIWINLGYRVTFFPDNLDSQFKYRHALEALGVEVFHGNYGIADVMAHRQFDFALICRVDIGQRYIPFVRLLSPKTVIFYDTVDIHYIREQRQAEIENNPELAIMAKQTKRKELANCISADKAITVTQDDGYHLQKELPNLDFAVIPNIHKQHAAPTTGFEQRDGLVFIGNYNHQPNEDAMCAFVQNVLPKIHKRLPEVTLYMVGSNMNDKLKALTSEHVTIVGWVDEVEPEFAKRRVFVSYLRYGAGMKGKLGQALSLGLPVVSTTVGAEGMGLKDGETALIADDEDGFAEAVWRLYNSSELWDKLSQQGRDYIEEQYGETAVKNKLQTILAEA